MKNFNYNITFYFLEDWRYISMNSNQVAIYSLKPILGDSVWELHENCEEKSDFYYHFEIKGTKYVATFSYDDVTKLNVYAVDGDDETLVQENIPYMIINIKDGENIVYNLGDLL